MDGPAQRPVVGAAMTVELLPAYQDWLFEHGGRDLELQDPVSHEVLDGDWGPLVRQIRALLQGYNGRLGIHGPYDPTWRWTSRPSWRLQRTAGHPRALRRPVDGLLRPFRAAHDRRALPAGLGVCRRGGGQPHGHP